MEKVACVLRADKENGAISSSCMVGVHFTCSDNKREKKRNEKLPPLDQLANVQDG